MESGWKAVDVTPGYYYNVETLQKMVNTPEQIKKNAALKNNGYKGKQTAGPESFIGGWAMWRGKLYMILKFSELKLL